MTETPDHLARDFVGYGRRPPDPQWPGGARLALNIVVNYEEGSELSVPDGDGVTETGLTDGGGDSIKGRDLGSESMFEYGSRAGVWRIFRLLGERGVAATVFGCARALERNPEICTAIREAGYDVCSHGLRWVQHRTLAEDEERRHIAEAVASIARTMGERPVGWYCRHGPGVNTRRLVVEEGGFLYDSDTYNDDLPYWRKVGGRDHLVIPYTMLNNDAKFLRSGMWNGDDYFTFMRDAVDFLVREGAAQPKMMSIGLHTRIIGHPGRAVGLERFLDYIAGRRDVWLCKRLEIARHWHAVHPPA